MDRKLEYRKLEGTREPGEERPKIQAAPSQVIETMPDSTILIPSSYKKEDGVLSYSLIRVISGGTDRERTFLNELERKHTFKAVDVIFVSTVEGGGGLTPKMMMSAYEEICKEGDIKVSGRTIHLESADMIYMFTDVDHYESELKDILKANESSKPGWIISNPDFEIWLYYCYRNNPEEDL